MPIAVAVARGDITTFHGDAVVNAANNHLLLGAGVAGAIARRGGPVIQAECKAHGPIAVGQATLTGAGDLPARFVIHAAAMGDEPVSASSIRSATDAALRIAERHQLRRLAFPVLGSGVGGFAFTRAAHIMLDTVRAFEPEAQVIKSVLFYGYTSEDARVLQTIVCQTE